MKKLNFYRISLVLAAATAASLSCTRELEVEGVAAPDAADAAYAPDNDSIQQGWVRIKLCEEEVAQMRVGAFTRGELESGNTDIDRIAAALGATEVRRVFSEGGKFAERRRRYGLHLWYDIKFDEALPVTRAVAEFEKVPGVEFAEPVYIPRLLDNSGPALPAEARYMPAVSMRAAVRNEEFPFDDPDFGLQWHYYNDGTAFKDAVAGADINLLEGWKITTGKPEVIVAIGDYAVQYDHPDLAANMWINPGEIPGNDIDDDGNGYIDDIYGWNVCNNTGVLDPGSHGTHIAGTVAAVNNNGIGCCGIAGGDGSPDSGVRMMSLQTNPPDLYEVDYTYGASEDIFAYEADNGAVISQNSWGYGPAVTKYPEALRVAIHYFIDNAGTDENGNQVGPMKGGIVMCSAGNENANWSAIPSMDPDVVSVAALNHRYKKASYSNYHPAVNIIAPGGEAPTLDDPTGVYSTLPNDGYGFMAGTSMSCPHVSGVAALIVSLYGGEGFTADQCKEILYRSCRTFSNHVEAEYVGQLGVGLVDAGLIDLKDNGSVPEAPANAKGSLLHDNIVTLEWTVTQDGYGMSPSYFLLEGVGRGIGKMEGVLPETPIEPVKFQNYNNAGDKISQRYTGNYNTQYDLTLSAVDRFGKVSSKASFTVSTGDYENRPPHANQTTMKVEVPQAGEEAAWEVDLNEYFYDDDAEYGDVLSFSITNRYENIVKTALEGSNIKFVPLAKGVCNIIISAIDLDGNQTSMTWNITVKEGPDPSTSTPVQGALAMPAAPVDATLSIGLETSGTVEVCIRDMAAREVVRRSCEVAGNAISVDVSALAAGVYDAAVTAAGTTLHGTFVKR